MPLIPFPAGFAISSVLAYFLGGLPFGYWFVRLSSGKDIRQMGSGNIGATNVHRTSGWKAGIVVLLLDVIKGFLAVWIAALITQSNPLALSFAAVLVMVGHSYPVLLRFKGGKAVACFIGAFLYLTPLALGVTALVFIAVFGLSKFVSLASITGAAVFPFIVFIGRSPQPIIVAAFVASGLIIYRHRANISRLRGGTEHVFSSKGGKA